MKNIAIITGGDSKEYKISLMSAETVYNNLDREKFLPYIIEIKNNIWKIKINDSYKIIEKDHLTIEINNEKIEFKDVFMSLLDSPSPMVISSLFRFSISAWPLPATVMSVLRRAVLASM